jgi:hypothetical protein
MNNLINYLESLSNNKKIRLFVLIDYIIENFNFFLVSDSTSHDIRTIIFKKNNNVLKISSTFIFNEKHEIMNNVSINLNNTNSYILFLHT